VCHRKCLTFKLVSWKHDALLLYVYLRYESLPTRLFLDSETAYTSLCFVARPPPPSTSISTSTSTSTTPHHISPHPLSVDGMAHLIVPGEFQAQVSLRMAPQNPPHLEQLTEQNRINWVLYDLKFHLQTPRVSDNSATAKSKQRSKLVSREKRKILVSLVNRAMAGSNAPLTTLYHKVHTFCVRLQLELLRKQSSSLALQFGSAFTVKSVPHQSLAIAYWPTAPAIPIRQQLSSHLVRAVKSDVRTRHASDIAAASAATLVLSGREAPTAITAPINNVPGQFVETGNVDLQPSVTDTLNNAELQQRHADQPQLQHQQQLDSTQSQTRFAPTQSQLQPPQLPHQLQQSHQQNDAKLAPLQRQELGKAALPQSQAQPLAQHSQSQHLEHAHPLDFQQMQLDHDPEMHASSAEQSCLQFVIDRYDHISVRHNPPIDTQTTVQTEHVDVGHATDSDLPPHVNPECVDMAGIVHAYVRAHAHMRVRRLLQYLQASRRAASHTAFSKVEIRNTHANSMCVCITLLDNSTSGAINIFVNEKSGHFVCEWDSPQNDFDAECTASLQVVMQKINVNCDDFLLSLGNLRSKLILTELQHRLAARGIDSFRTPSIDWNGNQPVQQPSLFCHSWLNPQVFIVCDLSARTLCLHQVWAHIAKGKVPKVSKVVHNFGPILRTVSSVDQVEKLVLGAFENSHTSVPTRVFFSQIRAQYKAAAGAALPSLLGLDSSTFVFTQQLYPGSLSMASHPIAAKYGAISVLFSFAPSYDDSGILWEWSVSFSLPSLASKMCHLLQPRSEQRLSTLADAPIISIEQDQVRFSYRHITANSYSTFVSHLFAFISCADFAVQALKLSQPDDSKSTDPQKLYAKFARPREMHVDFVRFMYTIGTREFFFTIFYVNGSSYKEFCRTRYVDQHSLFGFPLRPQLYSDSLIFALHCDPFPFPHECDLTHVLNSTLQMETILRLLWQCHATVPVLERFVTWTQTVDTRFAPVQLFSVNVLPQSENRVRLVRATKPPSQMDVRFVSHNSVLLDHNVSQGMSVVEIPQLYDALVQWFIDSNRAVVIDVFKARLEHRSKTWWCYAPLHATPRSMQMLELKLMKNASSDAPDAREETMLKQVFAHTFATPPYSLAAIRWFDCMMLLPALCRRIVLTALHRSISQDDSKSPSDATLGVELALANTLSRSHPYFDEPTSLHPKSEYLHAKKLLHVILRLKDRESGTLTLLPIAFSVGDSQVAVYAWHLSSVHLVKKTANAVATSNQVSSQREALRYYSRIQFPQAIMESHGSSSVSVLSDIMDAFSHFSLEQVLGLVTQK
jgi:hypothetical protein